LIALRDGANVALRMGQVRKADPAPTEEAAEKVIFPVENELQGLKPHRIFNILRHD
jgi:hypothetical protein